MGKIIELHDSPSHKEAMEKIESKLAKARLKEYKKENKRIEEIHKLHVRDRNRKHIILCASALLFLTTVVLKYTNNIPIPTEIIVGIPASAILTGDIPKNITDFFKKPPP